MVAPNTPPAIAIAMGGQKPPPPNTSGVKPAMVVNEVATMMRPRARAKGIDLLTEFASSIPQTVVSDPTRLRQIIINEAAGFSSQQQQKKRGNSSYPNPGI